MIFLKIMLKKFRKVNGRKKKMNIENELKSIEQMIKEDNYRNLFFEKFLKKENISFNQLENIDF